MVENEKGGASTAEERKRAQTAARVARYRERKLNTGEAEVRGIFAPQSEHERIKQAVREMLETGDQSSEKTQK